MRHVVRSFHLGGADFEHLYDPFTQATSLRRRGAPSHDEPLLVFDVSGLVQSPGATEGQLRLEARGKSYHWVFYPLPGASGQVLEANRLDAEVSVSREYLARSLALTDSEGGCCD